ncbi:MAG: hypothetical protein MJ016_08440, partial [Victivallaceae bacterium]|nr:hypothetical protein [Victivallaceae bacterium]
GRPPDADRNGRIQFPVQMERPLSRRQKELLDFIRDYFCRRDGMAPTIRECARHFGICDSTVFAHLAALVKKGYIVRTSQARSIVLKDPGFHGRLSRVPLWETIDGDADFAGQNFDSTLMMTLPVRAQRCFAVRVGDDALHALGIRTGDLVVAAPGGMPFVVRFSPDSRLRALGVVVAVERFYR